MSIRGVARDAPADAMLAARMCGVDPRLGGMLIRGGGAARDEVIAALKAGMPAGAPVRRLPGHIDDERLLGGIDLAAALGGGGARARAGLLAEADGGLVVMPMAERTGATLAGRIAGVLDRGEVVTERDGVAMRLPSRIMVAMLDDGAAPDERPPAALAERVAFHLDLDGSEVLVEVGATGPALSDDAVIATLVETAAALGIDSARAAGFALRAARASAALAGRARMTEADVLVAARLVLGPRAMRLPAEPEAGAEPPPPLDGDAGTEETDGGPLGDRVIAATRAALPAELFAALAAGQTRGAGEQARGQGERRRAVTRGRPAGTRAGRSRAGARMSLVDTLRAAAPWQALRRDGAEPGDRRVRVQRDDIRIRRFVARAEQVTIFVVDASGSAAMARLAEAKGAVELLLAEAYVARAQVALVAFRGTGAELLLPPTRSLARARRALAELPGGGGTPLAAGLDLARVVAVAERARGRTPFIVLLTDGRANVTASGSGGRPVAEAEAMAAARAIGTERLATVFIDTSARPRSESAQLAAAMKARHLPLPYADAATMHAAVRTLRPERG